jgi:hypothetical protein
MRTLALLSAACMASFLMTPSAKAQHQLPGRSSGSMQNMMQQQMRQQQQMMQQQQRMMQQQAQQQQKMMQQQQKAMEQQQKLLMQQQQKAMQQQQQQQQHPGAQGGTHPQASAERSLNPSGASPSTTTNVQPGTTHTSGASTAKTTTPKGVATHVVQRPHGLFLWPRSSSASYRNLMRLKRSLDGIRMRSTASASQKLGLSNALMGVVENSPRPPVAHVQQLAGDLAGALANRGTQTVNTQALALHLRAMMNVTHLSSTEAEQALTTNAGVLQAAHVSPVHVETVASDLRYLATEVSNGIR